MAREAPAQDVVLLHSPTDDGAGIRVIRARENRIEVGEVRALEEGKPITGDVVRLKPREGQPQICDVEVAYEAPNAGGPSRSHEGPARVSNDAYRDSWERVFGPGKNSPLTN